MNWNIERKLPFFNLLFTLIIALYHANASVTVTGPTDERLYQIEVKLLGNLGYTAMAFFFFVSAYLLFRTFTLKSYFTKLKRRLKSLLLPFFLWNTLCYGLYLVFDVPYEFKNYLKGFILNSSAPDAPQWYMLAVFLLAVFSPLFYLLFRNKKVGCILLYVLVAAVFFCQSADFPFYAYLWGRFHLGNIFLYLPCYLAGAYLGIHRLSMTDSEGRLHGAAILLVCLLLDAIFKNTLVNYLNLLLPVFLLCMVPYRPFMENKRIYLPAFFIYSVHWPFYKLCLPAISEFICDRISHATFQYACIRLAGTIGTVAVSCLLYALLYKLCPPALSLLTGGRAVPAAKKKTSAAAKEA